MLLSAALVHQGRSYRQLAVTLPVLMLVPALVLVEGWLQQLLLLAYTRRHGSRALSSNGHMPSLKLRKVA